MGIGLCPWILAAPWFSDRFPTTNILPILRIKTSREHRSMYLLGIFATRLPFCSCSSNQHSKSSNMLTGDEQLTLQSLAGRITSLSTQIQQHSQSSTIPDSDTTIDGLKKALHEAAQDIQTLVVGPKIALRALYGTHYDLAAHQVALEFDFFGKIPLKGRITAVELAKETNLSHDIVSRVLRLLATQKIFQEVAENEFTHTMLSTIVAEDNDLKASFHMQMDELLQAAADTASYLRENPDGMDDTHCPFTKRHQMPILQYYIQNSEKGMRFGRAMAGATKCRRICPD